jgi:hypothetical protein
MLRDYRGSGAQCPGAELRRSMGCDGSANGVEFVSTADVLELSRDRAWLVKMTNAVCQHWQRQNVKRKSRSVSVSPSGPSPVVALAS